jgi:O-acetyl-ADP-ribose deacetylase
LSCHRPPSAVQQFADITSIKVDAIVNPTKSSAGSGPVGEATVTTGGNLLCKFIIHAVAPRMGEGDEDRKLRSTTMSALQRGEDLAIASIAFPAMSTSTFGFSVDRCARVMLGATLDFRPQARSLRRAVYCLFGPEPYEVFARVLRELQE